MARLISKRFLAAALSLALSCPAELTLAAEGSTAKGEPMAAPSISAPVSLDGLEIAEDAVKVKLSGAVKEDKINSFVTANPPRLVIELLDTDYQLGAKSVAGKGKYLLRVRSGQYERSPRMISRIVMDLSSPVGHRVSSEGKVLTVSLGGEPAPGQAPAAKKPVAKKPAAPAPKPAAAELPLGQGRAEAPAKAAPAAAPQPQLEKPSPAPAPAKPVVKAKPRPARKPAAQAPVMSVPAAAPVQEASAPIAAAPAPAEPEEIAMPAEKKEALEPPAQSADASAELSAMAAQTDVSRGGPASAPEPAASAPAPAAAKGEKKRHRGCVSSDLNCDIMSRLPRDLVTLDFDNTDIKDIIKLLAAKARVNIVHGGDVVGTLTLHLSDVPFNDAFRTILTMMKLGTAQVGDNILRVASQELLTKERNVQTVGVTKVIQLSYTKAAEMLNALSSVSKAEGRTGTIISDPKTNSLIITDSVEGIGSTERLVAQLDVRPRQVLIEAKLVEVSYNRNIHFGIQWDYFEGDSGKALGKQGQTFIGSDVGPNSSTFGPPLNEGTLKVGTPPITSGRNTGVFLPASNVFGALTLGRVTNNYFLNATLTAAAAQGKVKVLSDPKIATLNNQPANINVTTSIPYVTSNVASTGVTSQQVSFIVTGIQLSVTPTINADGRVTLEINPSVSQPSATAAGATNTGAVATDTRSAKTVIIVRDGETIVIGGLISDTMNTTISKIPFLGDLPVIGWLFKKKSVVRSRGELLIFVTPKILD